MGGPALPGCTATQALVSASFLRRPGCHAERTAHSCMPTLKPIPGVMKELAVDLSRGTDSHARRGHAAPHHARPPRLHPVALRPGALGFEAASGPAGQEPASLLTAARRHVRAVAISEATDKRATSDPHPVPCPPTPSRSAQAFCRSRSTNGRVSPYQQLGPSPRLHSPAQLFTRISASATQPSFILSVQLAPCPSRCRFRLPREHALPLPHTAPRLQCACFRAAACMMTTNTFR